ncbi:hypothetical protein DLAC_08862 [Tieghemostelium lacteum]|uniref:Condensation domain-containing protein n=1 Tax=Tieghemostelium lacteum TaxID=361077 RepID=A0A151Z8G3_TIELA|nr:hypothetical protein DLAC_08862 [Tieghemostelium lacteum]|eukprot:KYQ90259.1 hypothetical protein DLAC_08862 [Tieghemostelium lacteum]
MQPNRGLNIRETYYTYCNNISNIVIACRFRYPNSDKNDIVDRLQNILGYLQSSNPLLRCTINIGIDKKWIFEQSEFIKDVSVKILNVKSEDMSMEIKNSIEFELSKRFDIDKYESLMRLKLLVSDNKEEYYGLILTSSHTAFDGKIAMYFFKSIMNLLANPSENNLQQPLKQSLQESNTPLRPPEYESWFNFSKLVKYIGSFLAFEWYRSPKRFLYQTNDKSTIDSSKTKSTYIKLDESQTVQFIQECKKQQCSVTSALSTLLAYSVSHTLDTPFVSGGLAVDLRSKLNIKEYTNGVFISTLLLCHNLSGEQSLFNSNNFWSESKRVNDQLKYSLENGDHFRLLSLNLMKKDQASNGSPIGVSYALSSLGNISMDFSKSEKELSIEDLQITSTIQPPNNQLVELTTVTLNNRIHLDFGYVSSLNRDQVDKFIQLFQDYLNNLLQS